MIEIKNVNNSVPIKFGELQYGETFSCKSYIDKPFFFIKVEEVKNNLKHSVNAICLQNGGLCFFNNEDDVDVVKIICEIEYL